MPISEDQGPDKSRRTFLKEISAFQFMAATLGRSLPNPSTATAAVSISARSGDMTTTTSTKKKMVAIQIGARSFVDEGVDQCLDTLQERAAVNVLMPTVFTYGRGLAGRQVPGQPLPDHGVQEYDEIHGGSYTKLHPEFYEKSVIKDFRAPELGDFDVLTNVTAKARTRGMQVYCLFEEAYNPRLIPNFEKIAEVDVYGRIGGSTCHNNPDTRLFLASMVKDWLTTNDLDGMMWESERQGPLNNTLEAHFGRIGKSRSIYCFCAHCVRKAKESGIDVERARQGYVALDRWVGQNLRGARPSDGTLLLYGVFSLNIQKSWLGRASGSTARRKSMACCTAQPKRPTRKRKWDGTSCIWLP